MLPFGVSHERAEALIRDIARAKLVAVKQQGQRSGNVRDELLREELCPDSAREALTEHRVAVAGDDADGHARRRELAQARRDMLGERVGELIVTDPSIEEITQNVELGRAARRA